MADLLLEFEGPEALARAARELQRKGYTGLDAYTPYSTEEVRDALPQRHSWIPYAVLLAGLCGAGGAYLLQWYLVAYLYPIDLGGRPPHMPLAFVPITFEMGVLCASLTAFFGVLWAGRLVRPWHPVFEAEGFESTSIDKFWLSVPAADAPEGRQALESVVESLGAERSVYVASEVRR
jgi:hypothetical protein